MSRSPAIRLTGLAKTYPPGVRAVDGVDLEVFRGECFGLLGPNGAGKTTAVEICEGLLDATDGEVEVLGLGWRRNERELRQRIGVSLQETRLSDKATVAETVRLFRSFYRQGLEPEEALRLVGLTDKAASWVERLSGGQKRRLEIACAIVGRPELLFLDEPTTGLDPQARRQCWEIVDTLRAEGRTVLLTTHYMDEAEKLCDRVAVIDRGKVIALGSPAELIGELGGDRVIEFAFENSGAHNDWWSELPQVRETRSEGGRIALTVSDPLGALPALLRQAQSRGAIFSDLTTRHATLEDVFLKLTGRHLSEEERT